MQTSLEPLLPLLPPVFELRFPGSIEVPWDETLVVIADLSFMWHHYLSIHAQADTTSDAIHG